MRRLTLRAVVLLTLVALCALPAALATAQRTPNQTLTIEDNGSIIQMRVGDVLQVELPDTPESGFVWLVVPTETFAHADVVIGDVWAVGPAVLAGFEVGDQILAVNEQEVTSTLDLDSALEDFAGDTVPVLVQRGEEQLTLDLTLETFDGPAIERPILTGFLENMPAAEAGFAVGDVLLAIDGEDVTAITALQEYIGTKEGAEVVITVRRGADKLEIPVTPQMDADGVVRIGISIVALDYAFAGLGIANLNVESYLGVRPFNSPVPLPMGVERRFMIAQLGDPQTEASDDPETAGLSIWQFEGIGTGSTRLTLLHYNPEQDLDSIEPEQFFEVFVEVGPARGPAA